MTQKSCAVGMHNAIPRNHLNDMQLINEFSSPDLTDNFTCLQTLSFGNGFILAVAITVLPGTTGTCITPQIYMYCTLCILCKGFIKVLCCSKAIIGFLGQANLKYFQQILYVEAHFLVMH